MSTVFEHSLSRVETRRADTRSPAPRAWPAAALGLVLAFLIPLVAHAQRTPRADFVSTHWGWGGVIKPDRCAPLRVIIRAGPRNFDGVLSLTYAADSTQNTQLIATADATANQTREIDLVVPVPGHFTEADLQLLDERGVARSLRLNQLNPDNPIEQLGTKLSGGLGLAAEVGVPSVRNAFESIQSFIGVSDQYTTSLSGDNLTQWRWQNLYAVEADAHTLPLSDAAYESLDLLVVNPWRLPTSSASAAATRAALRWVRSGGRLVVLVHRDGSEWMNWLDGRPLVHAAPVGDLPAPAEIASAFEAGLPKFVSGEIVKTLQVPLGGRTTWSERTAPDRLDTLPVGAAALAPSVKGRSLSLTPLGEAHGWTLRWTLPPEPGAPSAGLLAEGPFGGGWITFVGVDPASMAARPADAATKIAWRDAARVALDDYLKKPRSQRRSWLSNSDDAAEGAVLVAALDASTNVPPISDGVFYAIAICVLVLALLIGPFDAIVLRIRRARHRSWLTALGWIVLVSAASTVLPPLLRSGPSQFGRYAVIDALVEPTPPGEAPIRDGWRSEVIGYWANGPSRVGVETLPGDVWRGFSSNASESAAANLFDPLRVFAADPSKLAPDEFRMNQWTFRTFFVRGQAPSGSTPLDATLTRDADGYRIDLRGLPQDARILRAGLHVGSEWWPATFVNVTSGRAAAPSRFDAASGADAFGFNTDVFQSDYGVMRGRSAGKSTSLQAAGFGLPGARERSKAADHRVASGRFAAIYLATQGGPPTVRLRAANPSQQQLDHDVTIIRLVVPFTQPGAKDGPTPAESTT